MSRWKYMGVNPKAQLNKIFKTVPEVLSSIKVEAQERGRRKDVLLKRQRGTIAEDTNFIRDN